MESIQRKIYSINIGASYKFSLIFLFLQLFTTPAIGQIDLSEKYSLQEISSFALRGNDTTLVLLQKIEPTINFENKDKRGFDFLVVKAQYYENNYNKDIFQKTLIEANKYYDQSENIRLKLWHDIRYAYTFSSTDKETKLNACMLRADSLNEPDLLVDAAILLGKHKQKNTAQNTVRLYFEKALSIAQENDLTTEKADALYELGKFMYNTFEYDQALELLDKAKNIYLQENHKIKFAKIIGIEASIFRKRNYYGKALKSYNEILNIYEQYNHNYKIARTHEFIGATLNQIGRHYDAVERFKLALNYVTLQSNPGIFARLNRHIGDAYLLSENYKESENYLKKSIALHPNDKKQYNLRFCYNSLGYVYFKQGKLDKAEVQFNKTIEIRNKLGSDLGLDKSYLGLLEIYLEKEDYIKAKKYGELALSYCTETENKEIKYAILSKLSVVETNLGNHKQSNQYHKQSDALQASIANFKELKNFANIMAEYKNQATELENLNLKSEYNQNEATIRANKLHSRFYQLGLIFIIITLLLFAKNYFENIRSNKKLEEIYNSLNATNHQLKQSNSELEKFAHIASHDLKSPLRTITSFSSILQKRILSKLDDKEKEYFNFISKSGKNLSVMIDDMLSYSKVGSQELVLQEVNLNHELKDVILTLKNQADENAVVLKQLTPFPVVMADALKLKRVFLNIVSNAIKFRDINKESRYVHFSYKKLADYHQFAISDNGIGIPTTAKNIFEPFAYLNSNEEYKGTGMGLAMSKKIINKHGGDIWYESELGKSTIFYLNIKKHR